LVSVLIATDVARGSWTGPHPHPRSRRRSSVEELPLVLQRAGTDQRRDLRVVAVCSGGTGNRNDPVHYRGSNIESLCREHGRVLAEGGYRAVEELVTPAFARNRIVRDASGAVIESVAPA
jgi:hypothetical protein